MFLRLQLTLGPGTCLRFSSLDSVTILLSLVEPPVDVFFDVTHKKAAQKSPPFKNIRLLLAASLIVVFLDFSSNLFNQHQVPIYAKVSAEDLRPHTSSVYIASVQYNSETILRDYWLPSLLKLVGELVYLSIYESGSVDGTKDALSKLSDS